MGRKILFITTDQQRYDSLGCNGGRVARTPVADRLAAEGINYHRAHNQNVVCMPARSSMITGQYVRTHGVTANGALCPDETAFLVPGPEPALTIADGVVRDGSGPLAFVPDFLMGDDPETVKRGLKAAYGRILDLGVAFDHLLLAHGDPWIGGARKALQEFVEGA